MINNTKRIATALLVTGTLGVNVSDGWGSLPGWDSAPAPKPQPKPEPTPEPEPTETTTEPGKVDSGPIAPVYVCELVGGVSLDAIPEGYRLMSMNDVIDNADECRAKLGKFGIAALSDGKADGEHFGNNLIAGNHLNCDYIGQMLVMTGEGNDSDLDWSASCGEIKRGF